MDALHSVTLHLTALAYALPRMLVVFSIVPLLVKETMPMMLRVAVASAFALLLVPALVEPAARHPMSVAVMGLMLKEAFIGLVIGLIVALPLWAMEGMGDLTDTQRGASIAQALNPLTGHETSPLGQLFSQTAVTLVFAMGGFTALIALIYRSYELWPVFEWWPRFTDEAPMIFLGFLDRLMYLTVLLSAPVVFVMFIAEAGLAIISRFVPQLQVFFLAMPIKSALAILVFAVYVIVLFDLAGTLIAANLRDALSLLEPAFRAPAK